MTNSITAVIYWVALVCMPAFVLYWAASADPGPGHCGPRDDRLRPPRRNHRRRNPPDRAGRQMGKRSCTSTRKAVPGTKKIRRST